MFFATVMVPASSPLEVSDAELYKDSSTVQALIYKVELCYVTAGTKLKVQRSRPCFDAQSVVKVVIVKALRRKKANGCESRERF